MIYLLGYAAVVAVLAVIVAWFRPAWSRFRVVLTTALPGPALILIVGLGVATHILLQPAAPDEIDAGGMAMAAILAVSLAAAMGALFVGLLTTTVVSLLMRRLSAGRAS